MGTRTNLTQKACDTAISTLDGDVHKKRIQKNKIQSVKTIIYSEGNTILNSLKTTCFYELIVKASRRTIFFFDIDGILKYQRRNSMFLCSIGDYFEDVFFTKNADNLLDVSVLDLIRLCYSTMKPCSIASRFCCNIGFSVKVDVSPVFTPERAFSGIVVFIDKT